MSRMKSNMTFYGDDQGGGTIVIIRLFFNLVCSMQTSSLVSLYAQKCAHKSLFHVVLACTRVVRQNCKPSLRSPQASSQHF